MNTVLSSLVLRRIHLFVFVIAFTSFSTLACSPNISSMPVASVSRGSVGGG